MSQQARDAVTNCRQLTDLRYRYLLNAIADCSTSNRDGPFYAFPGADRLAYACVRSASTIGKWISRLVKDGYLTRARRQDGMAYFINLSTDGTLLDPPTRNHDGAWGETEANTDTPTVGVSDTPFSVSDTPFSVSDTPFFAPIKGTNKRENNTENREERLTYPQPSERIADPDPDSGYRWDGVVHRIESRGLAPGRLLPTLRRARLELYRETGQAIVICASSGDWFRGQFQAAIEQVLPAETQLAGWQVIVLTVGELARAVESAEREAEREAEADAQEYPETTDAELLPAQGSTTTRVGASQ